MCYSPSLTMYSHGTLLLRLLAVFSPVWSTVIPTPSPIMGTINEPAPLESLIAGGFPFNYGVSNWCEEGYNNFKVFASQGTSAPMFSDLDSDGDVPDALASWGTFTVANFGLPQRGTPPPSELVLPSLDVVVVDDDTQFSITVVQTFTDCPGHILEEIGVTSVPFVYALGNT